MLTALHLNTTPSLPWGFIFINIFIILFLFFHVNARQTVGLASAFHRALSELTHAMAANSSGVSDFSDTMQTSSGGVSDRAARLRVFTEMLKDDNVEMLRLADALKSDVCSPLIQCADDWKAENGESSAFTMQPRLFLHVTIDHRALR